MSLVQTLILSCTFILLASPFALALPQAVTATISPSGSSPPGCLPSYAGTFGIAVQNISSSTPTATNQRRDPTSTGFQMTVAHVNQIIDGQVQGGMHTVTMMPVVTQISDGQIQEAATTTMMPVTEIVDGQPQAPVLPTASTNTTAASNNPASASAAGTSTLALPTTTPSTGGLELRACLTQSTLNLTLTNSVLLDSHNRTGYIASNYQFQFDDPPQAGALYTAGWSVCANGSLALGGSNVFWQCRSGEFYNLYDRWWAEQCSPVVVGVVGLVEC